MTDLWFTTAGEVRPANPDDEPEPGAFESAELYVVYSATDEDAEIILAGGSEDPLAEVTIFGPGGTEVIDVNLRDCYDLGQADFRFNTPEPSLAELEDAHPLGALSVCRNIGDRH